ncbi:beta-lactamase family protein [Mucilaginibacter corticis]|uniref:Beta-lactamase family protein n=1 Tax=Mucilaginibacter corticis TaxID=2597670 RepID=A0A556M948_9SPHI|nr:serine hydrolase domain-containing protein [Mucilaginibacter corticis]TSJ36408.1 beta-lactamase family protein [Mucilaginibacter corticis]
MNRCHKFTWYTTAFLLVFSVTLTKGQTLKPVQMPAGCLDSIPDLMKRYKVPVVAASVFENGKIKETKVFGRLANGSPANINTLFNVASLTKPVTALLTLKLIDAGKLDLDEPLYKYWIDPDLKPDERYKRLTARIILSHQTGFPNWRSQNPDKKLAFMFDPGTKYSYSGEGYEYLRHALESKFHRSLQQLADSVLFTPLSMKNTRYGWSDRLDSARFADPHDTKGERIKMVKITQTIAADWLVTTISDYTKFGLAVLTGTALSPETFAQMVSPQVEMKPGTVENMGLGWEVMTPLENGEYLLMHTGADDGVKTLIILLPQSKRGIILFTNGNNGFELVKNIIKNAFHFKELTP